MTLAYLINQYPKVSHSFIRREIAAIEAHGLEVLRFAIRSCRAELVDPADQQELHKTHVLLEGGAQGLLLALLQVAISQPIQFLRAVRLTLKVGACSDRSLLHHVAYLAEACALLKQFEAANIRHVHAHFGTNSATVAMLCHALGGPTYSFTVHGPEEFDKPEALSLTEKINRAAFVVAISSYGKSQLYRWCHYSQWAKIKVVHCGVGDDYLNHCHVPIPATPQLVCVGRLSEQKGHFHLLEAVKNLADEGLNFKVVFVGDGPLRSQVDALITQYGLHHHIEITGWASGAEVQRHLLSSRALVLPSFAEGLPVVLMEALALGRPVISTYIAGIPELVEPGRCGWLVSSGSTSELQAAMKEALEASPETLEQMGGYGKERVAQRHNIMTEAAKLAHLFKAHIQTNQPVHTVQPTPSVDSHKLPSASH